MKTQLLLFVTVVILFISCRKDKGQDTIVPEPTKEIINSLVSGTDCIRFERLLKGYKMEDIRAVKQTKDGGYIFCGATETIAQSESDILIVKTDCFGKTEWMKTITNAYSEFGYDIIPVSSGGYFVAATVFTNPSYWKMIGHRGQFILLDSVGNLMSKQYATTGNATILRKAVETADGGFLICGEDKNEGNFILKTDAWGSQLRVKYLGNCSFYDIAVHNNKYLTCGSILNSQGESAIYLAEMNAEGDTLWTKSIDKNIEGGASSIAILNNNEIAIGGTYRTSNTTFAGFVMRLDAVGKEIWYRSLDADGLQTLVNVAGTSGNGIVTVGTIPGAFTIAKLDSGTGSILWKVTKSSVPYINDFQLTPDGGLIIVGNLFQSEGNIDGYILKTDNNGN